MAIDVDGLAPLLAVFDMSTSIRFYCEGLGFEIVDTDGKPAPQFDWVMLRLNGAMLMLNTAYDEGRRPPIPDPARLATHQDIGIYFGCPDVDGAYAHLRGMGINAKEPKAARYGMKQLYLTDPDGYVLCLQWPVEGQASDQ
jgi:glyoxylase I family protein